MNRSPIGIYDSGFGGLTVWRAIRDRMPSESLIYLGDGVNCPYGAKSCTEIAEFADRAVSKLIEQGCKLIVVACNTATIVAIESLRAKHRDIDIVGIEPAVKPACLQTRSGVVGVLATQRSLEGDKFQRTAARYSDSVRVVTRYGRGFVEIVEQSLEESEQAEIAVREVVEPMLAEGVDQIVLGCTHYPFLIPLLQRIAPSVNIIDPSPAVARRVEQLLVEHNLVAPISNIPTYHFLSFADKNYRDALEKKALGR